MINDHEHIQIETNEQTWRVSWHSPRAIPAGKAHGAAAICVPSDNQLVLVSSDGLRWDLPSGRPEANETWEQTLRREVHEEACATVITARLLGFCRSQCLAGREQGLVLVRSFWWTQVVLERWEPLHEIAHRRVVAVAESLADLPSVFVPVFRRAFREAGVL